MNKHQKLSLSNHPKQILLKYTFLRQPICVQQSAVFLFGAILFVTPSLKIAQLNQNKLTKITQLLL
jgi:hypothetical protein